MHIDKKLVAVAVGSAIIGGIIGGGIGGVIGTFSSHRGGGYRESQRMGRGGWQNNSREQGGVGASVLQMRQVTGTTSMQVGSVPSAPIK